MKLYKTIEEYAIESGFSLRTAKNRLEDWILEKINAVKWQWKIAWYVDIYEANLYFANAIMWKHLNKYNEPITSLWKWEINNLKKEKKL